MAKILLYLFSFCHCKKRKDKKIKKSLLHWGVEENLGGVRWKG